AHKAQDAAACEAAIKEIETAFGAAQQDILNAQAQAQAGANPGAGAPNPGAGSAPGPDDHVTDVDFEEVK
ncbi:MAG: molecular chaperone DnaK, partial [Muribaculaceae bacterium]|nr:molecular chaperone DnaK [Muribaculaceae bacterium]